jgi:hypothetical protein
MAITNAISDIWTGIALGTRPRPVVHGVRWQNPLLSQQLPIVSEVPGASQVLAQVGAKVAVIETVSDAESLVGLPVKR